MILAAGRGERMRPLTDRLPKPLLPVAGKPLIVHLIDRLRAAGFERIVINVSYLGALIEQTLGDGSEHGVVLTYSHEQDGPLETGGGIRQALPLLDRHQFLVVNGDIWTDFPFARLAMTPPGNAHLVLVPNPPHHPDGDFVLANGQVRNDGGARLTFSGIAIYRPALFAHLAPGRFALAPLLRAAMARGEVSGEVYHGGWEDIGTPARLTALDARLRDITV